MHTNTTGMGDRSIYGVIAEFDRPEKLVAAGRKVHHEHGYTKLDALSPFPVHGIDDAIGVPRSILGYLVFIVGSIGFLGAIGLIYYAGAISYKLVIGGKLTFALQPFYAITFGG